MHITLIISYMHKIQFKIIELILYTNYYYMNIILNQRHVFNTLHFGSFKNGSKLNRERL